MGRLNSIKLPLGTADERMTLTQAQVNTLINVYYDQNVTTKQISGYVYKESISMREHYILTQLGLDVEYETMTTDAWTFTSDKNVLRNGESATLAFGNTLTYRDFVLNIDSISVEYGSVTVVQVESWVTLENGVLSLDKGSSTDNFVAKVNLSAHPVWDDEDVKTLAIDLNEANAKTVWINPASQSTALEHTGSIELLQDYINRCKCYVFNSAGTKKAEIASATFKGNYSGMTQGTVTFADGTTANIADLNTAGCNFMVLRPELHIFSGLNENQEEILRCTGVFNAGEGEKVFPKKYIGMFKAFEQSSIMKSQPNRIPTGNLTIAQFQQRAAAGGAGYGLWNYTDWCKENAIHLAWFANTNYDVNVGIGRIGSNTDNSQSYNRIRNIVTGFTLPLAGQYKCGNVATQDQGGYTVNCLNFFGIEGMGEQIWEFVIGFRHNGTTAFIWEDNAWSETQAPDRTFNLGVTNTSGTFIKSILAGANFDMLPREVGASATTGMCDGHWVSNQGRLLFVGGAADHGSLCGLSASHANNPFSLAGASVGARLAFYGEPELVDGANLLV